MLSACSAHKLCKKSSAPKYTQSSKVFPEPDAQHVTEAVRELGKRTLLPFLSSSSKRSETGSPTAKVPAPPTSSQGNSTQISGSSCSPACDLETAVPDSGCPSGMSASSTEVCVVFPATDHTSAVVFKSRQSKAEPLSRQWRADKHSDDKSFYAGERSSQRSQKSTALLDKTKPDWSRKGQLIVALLRSGVIEDVANLESRAHQNGRPDRERFRPRNSLTSSQARHVGI